MGLLESLGGLVLIAGGVYAVVSYSSSKDNSDRLKSELMKNNNSCKNLIYKYNKSVSEGRPIMSHDEFIKELDKIIKNPKEKQQALDEIRFKEEFKEKEIQKQRERRKIGYKYDTEIFEIFDTNRELDYEELIPQIELKFRLDRKEAIILFELWKKNGLITSCNWNKNKWEVGYTLRFELYSIDKNDLTLDKWLVINNKKLNPMSDEEKRYCRLDEDLPF